MQKIRGYSNVVVYALAIALSFALSLFIFLMSNEPAVVSAERSGLIADKIAPIFISDFEELTEVEKNEILSDIDHIIRKIAHFCMYATLGALYALVAYWHEKTWRWHIVIPTVCGALYAASDEIHQAFVPGRGPLFTDVILDSAGVFCGVLFISFWVLIIVKRRK